MITKVTKFILNLGHDGTLQLVVKCNAGRSVIPLLLAIVFLVKANLITWVQMSDLTFIQTDFKGITNWSDQPGSVVYRQKIQAITG